MAQLELKKSTASALKSKSVRIDVRDESTVLFRRVPINETFFNKKQTNVLVKKVQPGMPFLVMVDHDLEYIGENAELAKAFAAGQNQDGWRALFLGQMRNGGFQGAVEQALLALGFEGEEPRLTIMPVTAETSADKGAGLLGPCAADLSSELCEAPELQPTVGRRVETENVISCLLSWQARLPLIVGTPGVGKTNLLYAVARRMLKCRPEMRLFRLDMADLLVGTSSIFEGEKEKLLAGILAEAAGDKSNIVIAIEHIELGALETPHASHMLGRYLDRNTRIIGTTLPEHLYLFRPPPLARRVHTITLDEPSVRETVAMLASVREQIAAYHKLDIDKKLVAAAVKAARPMKECFPGKALMVLDEAASIAALLGAASVTEQDILNAADRRIKDGSCHLDAEFDE